MIYFADTFYFLARLSPSDAAHSQAIAIPADDADQLVTTEWVLMEVADGLCEARNRRAFLELYDRLMSTQNIEVIPSGPVLFTVGVAFYRKHRDKDWSLTDCISFAVMRDRNITHVLTADHHFEQAGFVALLK